MADVSISLITMLSFVVGALSGAVILKFITGQKNEYENDILKTRVEYSEVLNIKFSGTINDLEGIIKEMKKQNEELLLAQSQLNVDRLTLEAEYIRKTEEEKKIAYEEGRKESLKDYKITCQQFFFYDDFFLKKYMKGGFKFQFFVKGIPVFAPIEIIVQEESKFDENIKQTIINATNQAIAAAANQLGGIQVERLPGVESRQVK